MIFAIALLFGMQVSNPIVDSPAKDAVKEKVVSQLIDNVREKVDAILDAKAKADAVREKIAAAKKEIADKIAGLKQQIKEDLIAQKKEQVKARVEEIKAKVDAAKEAIAQLQAIADKFNSIKSWVDATPELPEGWVMAILRPSNGGLKPVVVRPDSVTLPSLPTVSAYSSDLPSIAVQALNQCRNGECCGSTEGDCCDSCDSCAGGSCPTVSKAPVKASPKRWLFRRR